MMNHMYRVICQSCFGPCTDTPDHSTFESALARAKEIAANEGGPVEVWHNGEMVVSLASFVSEYYVKPETS